MHVGDLDGTATQVGGNRWRANVTITVHNAAHGPVSNATVSGSWTGTGGPTTCVTNANGQCTLTSNRIRNNVPSVQFTVNNLTHASLTYSPGANHDPDGDSNGTVITVVR
jgi:hypothetical protein